MYGNQDMKNKFIILLYILLAGIFWQWWIPGPRVANDISLLSPSLIKSQLSLPQTWSVKGTEGLGEYTVFTLWSWPFNFFQGFLANLNFSFPLIERISVIIPFLLIGAGGIWRLCSRLKLSDKAKFISALIYLANTYILLVIDGGQLTISLSYALFPWGYIFLEEAFFGSLKKKILAGLLFSVIGFFDIRFLFLFLILGLIKFLFYLKNWHQFLRAGFVVSLIFFGMHSFWLIPMLKSPLSTSSYTSLIQTNLSKFISFSHALFLQSPHWYKNIFGVTSPSHFEFIIFPIIAFLVLLFKKSKTISFWLVTAVVSLFLTKGTSEPLGNFYQWLFYNIPGFSLFRDSSKFFFLVVLSYSILIGISFDEINKKLKSVFFVALICFLILLISPVWLGRMTGTFSKPPFEKEYFKLNELISKDLSNSNVFWIPTISPLTVLDNKHPSVEASRLAQRRPFKSAIVGTYETFNFLREAPYMGQLFDVANIGYLAYPFLDIRRESDQSKIKYYYTFLNQLSNLPWLEKAEDSGVPLFKTKTHQDKFFIASNIWWVIGSDEIYKESTKSAELALSKNALVFAEEDILLGKKITEIPNAKIVTYKKDLLDFEALMINGDDLIFPANQLRKDPNSNGWWKMDGFDLVKYRDFLQTKYGIDNQDFDLGGSWAIGEGELKFRIKNSKFEKNKILLARALESSRSGQISFFQNSIPIGSIKTKNEKTNIKWHEVGKLKDNLDIVISTKGDINIVNAIASVQPEIWQNYKKQAEKYRISEFNIDNIDENFAKVNYTQLSPTKYSVIVSNLEKPAMLVFSQNFDSKWKLNGQAPLPVYSLLNGYYIEKSGLYTLEFEAQKFVLPGLVISTITLLICLGILLV